MTGTLRVKLASALSLQVCKIHVGRMEKWAYVYRYTIMGCLQSKPKPSSKWASPHTRLQAQNNLLCDCDVEHGNPCAAWWVSMVMGWVGEGGISVIFYTACMARENFHNLMYRSFARKCIHFIEIYREFRPLPLPTSPKYIISCIMEYMYL